MDEELSSEKGQGGIDGLPAGEATSGAHRRAMFLLLSRASGRAWIVGCSAVGVLVTLFVWIIAPALSSGIRTGPRALLAVGTGAAAFVVLGMYGTVLQQLRRMRVDFTKQLHRIRDDLQQGALEQLSLTNVRPVIGSLPLNRGVWAVDAIFAEQLVLMLLDRRPRLVVECGSGSSSVMIAATLKHLETGYLVSLEHDAFFAERTRALEDRFGVKQYARVVTAPLRNWSVGGETLLWYGFDPDDELQSQIDMLVVDGPPGHVAPRARYPAVPVLRSYLGEDCVILMDDGLRPDEQWIAQRWAEDLGGDLEEMNIGRGVSIIRVWRSRWAHDAKSANTSAQDLGDASGSTS